MGGVACRIIHNDWLDHQTRAEIVRRPKGYSLEVYNKESYVERLSGNFPTAREVFMKLVEMKLLLRLKGKV